MVAHLSEEGAEGGELVHGEGHVHVPHPHVAGRRRGVGAREVLVELAAEHPGRRRRRRLRVGGDDLGERPQQRLQLRVERLLRAPRRLLHVARPRRLLLRQRLHMPRRDLRATAAVDQITRYESNKG